MILEMILEMILILRVQKLILLEEEMKKVLIALLSRKKFLILD
jgi:hypothetical protein